MYNVWLFPVTFLSPSLPGFSLTSNHLFLCSVFPRNQYSSPGERAGAEDGGAELKWSGPNPGSNPGHWEPERPLQQMVLAGPHSSEI